MRSLKSERVGAPVAGAGVVDAVAAEGAAFVVEFVVVGGADFLFFVEGEAVGDSEGGWVGVGGCVPVGVFGAHAGVVGGAGGESEARDQRQPEFAIANHGEIARANLSRSASADQRETPG